MERELKIKNAISLVKETEAKWFRENSSQYWLMFTQNGNSMELVFDGQIGCNLSVKLSCYNDAYGNTKKYILKKLNFELENC